ncbi:MAG: SDR family NAD(P)-dependent oxidoreductase [Rhizomicrobium sp.]
MRNVIVTGGSRGIGLEIVRKLSDNYSVIAVARGESGPLSEARRTASETNTGSIHFRAFDLNDIRGTSSFVKSIRKEFGPIYGLVNNAAIGTSGILSATRNSTIEKTIQLNTLSPIILTKYVVRAMMNHGGGRIINIASIVGFTGFSGLSVYSATKASITGFTRALAREVGSLDITVNAIAPGFISTEMTSGLGSDQQDQIVRRTPLRRLAEPRDVAGAVDFLLSETARNITGTVLTIDAGSTA